MNDQTIKLMERAGTNYCVASQDGEAVYSAIREAIEKGNRVRLSFEGVEDLTSAFLNTAVGQLYGEYDAERLKEVMLPPENATLEDLELLKRVVDTAKAFFADPEKYRKAVSEVMGDDAE